MTRKNSNAHRGKPQSKRSKGGPANHHPYRVFGDTSEIDYVQKMIPVVVDAPHKLAPPRSNIQRTATPIDITKIRNFILDSNGQSKQKFRWGHKFGIVTPDLMDLIHGKFQASTATMLIDEFIKTHQDPVPYEVERLHSTHADESTVLMRAVPTESTVDALNQDILDILQLFGVEEPFRFRSLIVAKYPDIESSHSAEAMLTERLLTQGGVLLTFSGAKFIP